MPCQFVVPQTLGPERVVIGSAIHIHLARIGIAEPLACRGFQHPRTDWTEDDAQLRHPFTTCRRVVVVAQSRIESEPPGDVLSEIQVSCPFFIVRMSTLHASLRSGNRLSRLAVGVPSPSVDVLVVDAHRDAVALHQCRTLIP